jgi:hypothetical protein
MSAFTGAHPVAKRVQNLPDGRAEDFLHLRKLAGQTRSSSLLASSFDLKVYKQYGLPGTQDCTSAPPTPISVVRDLLGSPDRRSQQSRARIGDVSQAQIPPTQVPGQGFMIMKDGMT